MGLLSDLALRRRVLPVWYHPSYRLPAAAAESRYGLEPRRADFVAWFLQSLRTTRVRFRKPVKVSYPDMARVHTPQWLEKLDDDETLERVFGLAGLPSDELLATVRLGAGATVEAAEHVLHLGGTAINLMGGFHHAGPGRGGGFCLVNDIAIAVAVLRSRGFDGRVVILDLDAHPPDGTALCLADDPNVWIGSISGADWGPVDADETVLERAGDDEYLATLRALLRRMPRAHMAFVIAGGDVLAGDRFGALNLTEDGARQRDDHVREALEDVPSVWVPGGGYSPRAWRVLAGSALVLAGRSRRRIPRRLDPMSLHYAGIAAGLSEDQLGGSWLTEEDLLEALGQPVHRPRFLDYYTEEGIEYALHAYGLLSHLRRLGYDDLRVETARTGSGDRMRLLWGKQVLIELVASIQHRGDDRFLFVNWLTLRHPLGRFAPGQSALPGQDVPGLGMAAEAGELLKYMALRMGLAGVLFIPSWYHVAYSARHNLRFVDPEVQGRFEAMQRDLGTLPLAKVTHAMAEGAVLLNDEPFTWQPADMVARFERGEIDRDTERRVRDASFFQLSSADRVA